MYWDGSRSFQLSGKSINMLHGNSCTFGEIEMGIVVISIKFLTIENMCNFATHQNPIDCLYITEHISSRESHTMEQHHNTIDI